MDLSFYPQCPGLDLTEEQLNIFLKTIKADEFWYDFFYTELTTGLRRGEICGLMWTGLDERGGTLKVCRTLHREKGGRLVAGDTKTYAGTRKIVLPPSTVELLRCGHYGFRGPRLQSKDHGVL